MIAHLTSVHPRYDTRIFLKICTSLASRGNEVSLVVADGKGDEVKNGFSIMDVGASKGRFDRMRNAPKRVFARAAALKADLYNYLYYTIAGFTEHDTFRSNQIREGDLTRKEALVLVMDENRPRYPKIKWYLDAVGVDFKKAIQTVNKIPKLY